MKALGFLLTAGLATARIHLPRQIGINNLNISNSGASSFNLADFNLGELGLDGLEVGGLNLGTVDLGNQDVIAEAILAMLGGFCLGNTLDRNNILSFGFNNDVDLFFQLAQLMQLEQLGFLDLGGIQSLFNNGHVLGGFNLGEYPVFPCRFVAVPLSMTSTANPLRRLQARSSRGQEDHEAHQAATRPEG